jgi:hypothetical protein
LLLLLLLVVVLLPPPIMAVNFGPYSPQFSSPDFPVKCPSLFTFRSVAIFWLFVVIDHIHLSLA